MSLIKINYKEIVGLPNLISLFRLLLAIPIFITIKQIHSDYHYRYVVFALCILAFLTDVLDGYVARKYNKISETGKIIDPLADKVLMIIIVLQLYLQDYIPTIYLVIIIARDLLIFIGGIIVTKYINQVLPSNLLGKLTVLTIGLFILIVVGGLSVSNIIYRILFYLSIIMSFASVIGYALRAYEKIKWKRNEHL